MEKYNTYLKKILLILIFMLLMLGVSFAIFIYVKLGDKTNSVTTGTLIIDIDDSIGNAINVKNAYPVTDQTGLLSEPYKFKLTNKGSVDANYVIKLISDQDAIEKCGCNKKDTLAKSIRFSYTKKTKTTNKVGNITNLANSSYWESTIFDRGTIKANETFTYEIRMWIDKEASSKEASKHLHAKVQADAIQYTEDINE